MKKLFEGKKVTIMGLGLLGGGVETAKFFVKEGAKVLVTDLKTKEQLKESLNKLEGLNIEYVLGRHREKDFINADLVINNPGVPNNSPYLKIAKKNNVSVETDIGIFFKLCRAPIIGITGTKGKSTIASLLYLFLKRKFQNVILAGNIGISPLACLNKIIQKSLVVLELSSWQLEGLNQIKKSPKIALIANIYPDHLNRYKNLKDYQEAKKIIFKFQKKNDILVLNFDNPFCREFYPLAKSRVYFFSQKPPLPQGSKNRGRTGLPFGWGCFLRGGEIFFGKEKKPIFALADLKLTGEHNVSNILAATTIAKLLNVSAKTIQEVLKKFRGVPGRQEYLGEIRGVKYINDTTATMPEAAIYAINNLKERFPKVNLILIAGGVDKNLSYKGLAKIISKKVDFLILFPGSASNKIKRELKNLPKSFSANSMENAVKKANQLGGTGDIVLLSPAAASFNLFKNEFDRGRQFKEEVVNLKKTYEKQKA